jgi:hypothetical protein
VILQFSYAHALVEDSSRSCVAERSLGRTLVTSHNTGLGVFGAERMLRRLPVAKTKPYRNAVHLLALLLSTCILLGACSSSTSSAASNNTKNSAVVAAWRAALSAVDKAARTANWQYPKLESTHTGSQLDRVRDNLRAEAAAHEVAKGVDTVLGVEVRRRTNDSAQVMACVQGDEITVDAKTGKPASGIAGEAGPEQFNATMIRTAEGWKVASETVLEGAC